MKCPICEFDMEPIYNSKSFKCKRGCYSSIIGAYEEIVRVFDEKFEFSYEDSSESTKYKEGEIQNQISYWKNNERYVMRFLLQE